MFRRLIASAVAISLAAGVATAASLADLTGKWNVSIGMPGQARQALLTVTQKGDSLSGTIETEAGTSQIAGVMKGDSVFFGFQLDMGGQQLMISSAGALTDKDNLAGMLELGGMGGFPFTAVRQP
jgi:hypothetical protein